MTNGGNSETIKTIARAQVLLSDLVWAAIRANRQGRVGVEVQIRGGATGEIEVIQRLRDRE